MEQLLAKKGELLIMAGVERGGLDLGVGGGMEQERIGEMGAHQEN